MDCRTAIVVLSLALAIPIGCATGLSNPDQRGVRVRESEIPDAVEEGLNRLQFKPRSIEEIDGGRLFRIETESGSVIILDGTGKWHGTII